MPDRKTIWRRRVALMGAVALAVLVPVALLLRGGGGNDGSAEPVPLGKRQAERELGVGYRLPPGWKAKKKQSVLRITHRRRRDVAILISAPGPRSDADRIRREAVAALSSHYRRVEVLSRVKRQRIGGLAAKAVALEARTKGKDEDAVHILVATAKGKRKAYLVEVLAAAGPAGTGLIEAQSLLNELELDAAGKGRSPDG